MDLHSPSGGEWPLAERDDATTVCRNGVRTIQEFHQAALSFHCSHAAKLSSVEVNAMLQVHIERLVAEATGEDLGEIRQRGSTLIDQLEVNFDPEPDRPPLVVDWDELELQRTLQNILGLSSSLDLTVDAIAPRSLGKGNEM